MEFIVVDEGNAQEFVREFVVSFKAAEFVGQTTPVAECNQHTGDTVGLHLLRSAA